MNNCLYTTINYILNKLLYIEDNSDYNSLPTYAEGYKLINEDITKSVIIYHVCPDCGYKFSNFKCVCGYKYSPVSNINK